MYQNGHGIPLKAGRPSSTPAAPRSPLGLRRELRLRFALPTERTPGGQRRSVLPRRARVDAQLQPLQRERRAVHDNPVEVRHVVKGKLEPHGGERLSRAAFAPKLAEQSLGRVELVVEDGAGDIEQLREERVPDAVADRRSFPALGDDALVAEDRELLRHDRLLERQGVLQLLHGPPATHEELEEANARRVRERAEEARLEELQLTSEFLLRDRPASRLRH